MKKKIVLFVWVGFCLYAPPQIRQIQQEQQEIADMLLKAATKKTEELSELQEKSADLAQQAAGFKKTKSKKKAPDTLNQELIFITGGLVVVGAVIAFRLML